MANEIAAENSDGDAFPSAEELESLYLLLESSIPELQWKSPGRILEEDKVEKPVEESLEMQEPAKTDFDFSDDMAQPQLRPHTVRGQTPKSAKKKTANFADVVKRIKNPGTILNNP